MLKILTHNRPNSLHYYSSETTQVSAKKGLIHTLVHTLFSYTPNILLTDIHIFHIKQVSFCSTTGRGWPFLGASCHCTTDKPSSIVLVFCDQTAFGNSDRVALNRGRGGEEYRFGMNYLLTRCRLSRKRCSLQPHVPLNFNRKSCVRPLSI